MKKLLVFLTTPEMTMTMKLVPLLLLLLLLLVVKPLTVLQLGIVQLIKVSLTGIGIKRRSLLVRLIILPLR